MLINYFEKEERNEYLRGGFVFYLDHDIPISNSKQFLKELKKRAEPDEIAVQQEIPKGKAKYQDKWIHNGWIMIQGKKKGEEDLAVYGSGRFNQPK